MTRKLSSCCLGCLFYGGLTVLVLALISALPVWYFCIYAPPLVVSEATTRITSPLTEDGQVDFFKVFKEKLSSPELTSDENGYRIFVRQFGYAPRKRARVLDGTMGPYFTGGPEVPDKQELARLELYKKLDLDPDVPPTLVMPAEPLTIFKDYYEAREEELPANVVVAKKRDIVNMRGGIVTYDIQEKSWLRPWTLEQFPMFADWINEIDAPMEAIAEAVRKPVFLLDGISVYFVQFNVAGKILQARANYRIASGNIDGAIDDKLTLHRLGRLLTHKANTMQYRTGLGIEEMAMTIPIGANPEHPLTKEQVQRLLNGLNALSPRESLAIPYEWERLGSLSYLQMIMRDPSSCPMSSLYLFGNAGLPIDWNVVFRRVNELYDMMQDPVLRTKEGYDSVRDMRLKLHASHSDERRREYFVRTFTSGGRGMNTADFYFHDSVSRVDSFEWALHRLLCSENMHRLAWAILLYQHEHGTMPNATPDENWAVQIEKYLGENPEQYFSCPTTPSPEGMTTYAMVQYGDAIIDESGDTVAGSLGSILLVELKEAVPLDKAVVSVDDVLEWKLTKYGHPGGMNVTLRSGAVRFVSLYNDKTKAEWRRLLGREEKQE
jgi:hypothetical protein